MSQNYHILDLGLLIESDSKEFLGIFDRDYSWFRVPNAACNNRMSVCFRLSDEQGEASLRVNDTLYPLGDHPNPTAYAFQVLVRVFMGGIRDFSVLHAAVVAQKGEAVIICGPPGAGKTTLALKLLDSGLTFLSDDFCPIHKETRLVHPFPRSLWIERSSRYASRAHALDVLPGDGARGGKIPIKPTEGHIEVAAAPCKMKCLICLDPGEDLDSWDELEIGLRKEGEELFLDAINGLEEVLVKRIETTDPTLHEWQIRYPRGHGLSKKVKELLTNHTQHLWNVYRVDGARPDFAKEPVLTPIPVHQAVFFVMRELKQELIFTEQEGSSAPGPVGYFMQLSRLLEGISCYRLSPGRLDLLADLVCGALG